MQLQLGGWNVCVWGGVRKLKQQTRPHVTLWNTDTVQENRDMITRSQQLQTFCDLIQYLGEKLSVYL